MTFFRDFFRRRSLAQHVAKFGWRFDFHGIEVEIPQDTDLAVANALIKGKYESEEAKSIVRLLPANRPVIELGGSLGVISSLIGSHLHEDVPHVIVEANPTLIEICKRNVKRPASQVCCQAVSYAGPTVLFQIESNPHASRLSRAEILDAKTLEVNATTLAALWDGLGSPDGFTLIADIEGAEVDFIEQDLETVSKAGVVIMELHPHLYVEGAKTAEQIKAAMARVGFSLLDERSEVCVWSKSKY